jgi:hypothetical protein
MAKKTPEQIKNLKKWVEALRSGKYRQTTGRLKKKLPGKHVGYCCLGVACKVLGVKHDRLGNLLPDEAQEMLGTNSRGTIPGPHKFRASGYHDLWELNDHLYMSFKEIADVIEEKFIKGAK